MFVSFTSELKPFFPFLLLPLIKKDKKIQNSVDTQLGNINKEEDQHKPVNKERRRKSYMFTDRQTDACRNKCSLNRGSKCQKVNPL